MRAYAELLHSISVDGDDVPRIRERLGSSAPRAARPGVVSSRLKWPP
jgi:hypothetical protein